MSRVTLLQANKNVGGWKSWGTPCGIGAGGWSWGSLWWYYPIISRAVLFNLAMFVDGKYIHKRTNEKMCNYIYICDILQDETWDVP